MITITANEAITLAQRNLRGILAKFIGRSQRGALTECLRGEEREYFADMLNALTDRIESMPVTYQQDGLGAEAIVYLHYFTGGRASWFITEKDKDGGTEQAFGKADLYGDGGELGYISIDELTANNVEIDLHWTPKPLKECK
jgi:hypothetical protein